MIGLRSDCCGEVFTGSHFLLYLKSRGRRGIQRTLYVTDLDGTLLNTEERINPYSIDTINSLVEKGMLFTYAIARSLSSASIVAKGLSTNIPVIVYNGTFIINPATGEKLASEGFQRIKEIKKT